MIRISATDFGKYLAVQRSGVTNMLDIKVVKTLSGLSEAQIKYIMTHYEELVEEYDK